MCGDLIKGLVRVFDARDGEAATVAPRDRLKDIVFALWHGTILRHEFGVVLVVIDVSVTFLIHVEIGSCYSKSHVASVFCRAWKQRFTGLKFSLSEF